MDRQIIASVSREVYHNFPEVKGSQPEIRPQGQTRNLLVFHGKSTTEDGRTINRTVRVVVDVNGKIIKTTTSR
jgi:hypothetical protein